MPSASSPAWPTVQNDNVFEPYLAQVDTQIKQVDAILGEVDRNQAQVAELLRWVSAVRRQASPRRPERLRPGLPHQLEVTD